MDDSKPIPYHKRRVLSFKYAWDGIVTATKNEPNLKFHFFVAFLVILLGKWLELSRAEWVDVILLIGLVLTAEMTNSSIEAVVDSFTDQVHPGAKLAKDISAGAVLIVSITAAVIGAMIFLPHLLPQLMTL